MTRTAGQPRSVTRTTTTTTTTERTINRANDKPRRDGPDGSRPDGKKPGGAKAPDTAVDDPRYSVVNLRVNEIRCITTTKEIDQDEMFVAGIRIEGAVGGTKERRQLAARARRGEQVSLGKFAKGDTQSFPKTKVIASYDAGGRIGADPRFYLGAVVLVEMDGNDVGKVIDTAVDAIDKEVTTAVSAVAGTASAAALAGVASGAALGSAVPLIGTAIGAAAGAAVGLALGQIQAAHADDVFLPKRVELQLDRFPDEAGEIPGSRETLTFKGFHGHYEVTVSWAVR